MAPSNDEDESNDGDESNDEDDLVPLEVIAHGNDEATFIRPCVDCGQITGCYCDYCHAAVRLPQDVWADNQQTPLCSICDKRLPAVIVIRIAIVAAIDINITTFTRLPLLLQFGSSHYDR